MEGIAAAKQHWDRILHQAHQTLKRHDNRAVDLHKLLKREQEELSQDIKLLREQRDELAKLNLKQTLTAEQSAGPVKAELTDHIKWLGQTDVELARYEELLNEVYTPVSKARTALSEFLAPAMQAQVVRMAREAACAQLGIDPTGELNISACWA
jgi:cell division septum initiation protein DivIVA